MCFWQTLTRWICFLINYKVQIQLVFVPLNFWKHETSLHLKSVCKASTQLKSNWQIGRQKPVDLGCFASAFPYHVEFFYKVDVNKTVSLKPTKSPWLIPEAWGVSFSSPGRSFHSSGRCLSRWSSFFDRRPKQHTFVAVLIDLLKKLELCDLLWQNILNALLKFWLM